MKIKSFKQQLREITSTIDVSGALIDHPRKLTIRFPGGVSVSNSSGSVFMEWRKKGKLHRDDDLPARIHDTGTMSWWQNGKCHRDGDKPAVVSVRETSWWKNGKFHRENGKPALIYSDGTQYYYENNVEYFPNK